METLKEGGPHPGHHVLFFIGNLTLKEHFFSYKIVLACFCSVRYSVCFLFFWEVSQCFMVFSPQVHHSALLYQTPLWKGRPPSPGLPFWKFCLWFTPPGPIEGCCWKAGPRGGKGMGSLNRPGGNMGAPGIICGGIAGMFGADRNGGRWGFSMLVGCNGGIPGLGPGMTPGPCRVITGTVGGPSWLSRHTSEGVPVSALASLVGFSGALPPANKQKVEKVFIASQWEINTPDWGSSI